MDGPSPNEITRLLHAWSAGDQEALNRLMPLVYDALHRAAHRYMAREAMGHTLQTTALINEVYVHLVDAKEIPWQSRAHFHAVCARLMRRILTDFARARHALKRGGDLAHISIEDAPGLAAKSWSDLVRIDDALRALATTDLRKGQVVELRFFGGLSVQETARVLNVSPETVMRDWKVAKVWLLRELSGERVDGV
jgi:RNA polymerase sigma factor (TIGR02999 family)